MLFNHYVVIDGERYAVPDDGGLDAVMREILDAVRSGGAYVSLGRGAIGYSEVLVTPMTQVRIEHLTEVDIPAADEEPVDNSDPYWWS
jgi:hypothetical protein